MWVSLLEDNENNSITVNLSKGQIYNIDNNTENRSEFLLEILKDFIEEVEQLKIDLYPKDNRRHVTISNPGEELNKRIYKLVKTYAFFISRSELVRFALLYRYLKEQHDFKIQEKIDKENGIVRVPHVEKRIENCKTYKLVKEM